MASKKVVRTTGFADKFVVAGLPDITREGVELNAAQVKQAQEAAEVSNVQLLIDDELPDDSGAETPPPGGEGS